MARAVISSTRSQARLLLRWPGGPVWDFLPWRRHGPQEVAGAIVQAVRGAGVACRCGGSGGAKVTVLSHMWRSASAMMAVELFSPPALSTPNPIPILRTPPPATAAHLHTCTPARLHSFSARAVR